MKPITKRKALSSPALTTGEQPFKDWLRDQLAAHGLKPPQLAFLIGKSTKTIYEWLRGKGPHHPEMVRPRIEQLLGQAKTAEAVSEAQLARAFRACVALLVTMWDNRDEEGLRKSVIALSEVRGNTKHETRNTHESCQVLRLYPPVSDPEFRQSLIAAGRIAAGHRDEAERPIFQWRLEALADDVALFNRTVDTVPLDPTWFDLDADAVRLRVVKP